MCPAAPLRAAALGPGRYAGGSRRTRSRRHRRACARRRLARSGQARRCRRGQRGSSRHRALGGGQEGRADVRGSVRARTVRTDIELSDAGGVIPLGFVAQDDPRAPGVYSAAATTDSTRPPTPGSRPTATRSTRRGDRLAPAGGPFGRLERLRFTTVGGVTPNGCDRRRADHHARGAPLGTPPTSVVRGVQRQPAVFSQPAVRCPRKPIVEIMRENLPELPGGRPCQRRPPRRPKTGEVTRFANRLNPGVHHGVSRSQHPPSEPSTPGRRAGACNRRSRRAQRPTSAHVRPAQPSSPRQQETLCLPSLGSPPPAPRG